MEIEEVAALLFKGRIVDLSKKVTPGGAEGAPGAPPRRYELEQFAFPPGELMHYVSMESHISTHLEAPSHFVPALHGRSAEDISEVALDRFFGVGILVDCRDMAPRTAIGPEVLKGFGVRENDIVLIGRCPHKGDDRCYLHRDGAAYLRDIGIKMVGFDDTVFVEHPEVRRKYLDKYFTHDYMLSNGIPVIEQLAHLEDLTKPRFLFFGFPARMGGLESFPIRAVAIEPRE